MKSARRIIAVMVTSSLFLLLAVGAGAEPINGAEPSAAEVVALVNSVEEGEFVTRRLSMTLTDRRGKSRVRDTISFRKYFGDGKRTVMFYLEPANVKDTAFLTWDYSDPLKDDDQWLYLPALRKVRRISAADRGDYFLGTDFSYEDLKLDGKLSEPDYSYSIVSEGASVDGFVTLEALPKTEEIALELGYSRTVIKIDTSNWMVTEVTFWDTKGSPLKQLVASDIEQIDGIWTRHRLIMENQQTGHRTELLFSEVDYVTDVGDEFFNRQALSRGY